jgi:hypothetical protein
MRLRRQLKPLELPKKKDKLKKLELNKSV